MRKIAHVNSDLLLEQLEQEGARVDVLLCETQQALSNTQVQLNHEPSFSLITLDEEDLKSQHSILQGLYQVLYEELPNGDEDPLELIEALEEEIGEIDCCILVVENFSSCSEEAQASLLELVIVSRAFKLLLGIEAGFNFSQNSQLWGVLADRSVKLGEEKLVSHFDDANDPKSETSGLDISDEQVVELDEFSQEQVPRVETNDGGSQSDSGTNKKSLQWYQLIPKYHIAAAALLGLLVIALWQMDLSETKAQNISLDELKLEQQANEIIASDVESNKVDSPAQEDPNMQLDDSELQVEIIIDAGTHKPSTEELELIDIGAAETENIKSESASKLESEPQAKPQIEPAPEPRVVVAPKPLQEPKAVIKKSNFDWAPYQSDDWIGGVNSKYYTLQLMASHDQKGIKGFLSGYGVNSQYAVYSTVKDGRPWHVVIYGVYETHAFASEARDRLPDYLTSYSPWIRSFASVQGSLK